MRHSKRQVLTTQDIQASFKKLSIQETFGYPSSVPFNYEKLHTDNQQGHSSQINPTLWYIKPKTINLQEFI